MGKQLRLKFLLGILKDKASLVKANLSTKRKTASIRLAVIRATTRSPTQPPPDHLIAAVLSHGNGARHNASACVDAIMDRAHRSHNAYVVFKCLILLHNIVSKGCFILKDQVSFYPANGGRNFLNLSNFSDKTDVQTRAFSSWVRWYAGFLELTLITFRVLGTNVEKDTENLTALLNSDLLKETEALVSVTEDICRAPENLINQGNNLVYEVMRLVSENYRLTQHKITTRLGEFGDRLSELSPDELDGLLSCLQRLEECKDILVVLFLHRKRNDAFWELISQTRIRIVDTRKERENVLAITESTRVVKPILAPTRSWSKSLPFKGTKWLNVDRPNLVVSTVMA